jgi:tetratricopeptide (TPR) repeat protein
MSNIGCRPAQRILGFAVLALIGCGIARADDVNLVSGAKITGATGGRVRGQVTAESPTEVVVQLGATTTNVPTDQIASIRYDGQSASFPLAESRENGGQLAEAAELFKKAAAESESKPFLHQAALFREAQVLTELAMIEPDRMKEAKDKLAKFVQSYASGRHIVPARACQARLQLFANDFAGAEATIAALEKLPRAGEQAAVLRTKILGKQGKHDAAIAELDRLIATYPKGSERLRAAQLAKAESLAGMKKYKEAEGLLRDVILATPPEDAAAQAPAYNTLGDCLRAANRPKDALLAYLHTDLLYSKDKEEHPRALHHIAALFRLLKQDGRADEFSQRLKQDYPRSPWVAGKTADR